jgi:large subunit ribosomal protein L29
MNVSELRSKSDAELNEELMGLRKESFNLRMQIATGQLTRHTQIKVVRRSIARVKTIVSERSRGGVA